MKIFSPTISSSSLSFCFSVCLSFFLSFPLYSFLSPYYYFYLTAPISLSLSAPLSRSLSFLPIIFAPSLSQSLSHSLPFSTFSTIISLNLIEKFISPHLIILLIREGTDEVHVYLRNPTSLVICQVSIPPFTSHVSLFLLLILQSQQLFPLPSPSLIPSLSLSLYRMILMFTLLYITLL